MAKQGKKSQGDIPPDMDIEEVKMDIDIQSERFVIALEPELASQILATARSKGISSQTLVNLWLQEKLSGQKVC